MANNTMNDENKKKALDAAIAKLEKDFGKGAVMKLGDPAAQVHVETVPTGSLIWIWHLVLAAFRKDVLLKFMDLNQVVRRQLHYI